MSTGNDDLVRSSFEAFLRGDWDALSRVMAPDVQWLWHEPGDWDCHDRKKVLATLFERQREGVVTGLDAVVAVDERVFVEVTGPRLGHACMVVTVRDGRIVRMQDYPSRAAALAGAGLPPEPESASGPQADLTGDPPRLTPDAPLAHERHRGDPLRRRPRRSSGSCGTLRTGDSADRRPGAGGVADAASRRDRLAGARARGRREDRRARRRGAPTSTRAVPARTPRRRCTGRPAATTSMRSTRCSTPARTSKPTAP